MYKTDLQGGVTKGALTQEQAEAKFEKWQAEKESKVSKKVSSLDVSKREAYTKRMAAEAAVKEAIAAKVAAKNTPPPAEEAPAAEAEAPATPEAEA